ncbi:DUF1465 family protein [Rhodoligotrophos defluvii]|uniref:protease adaptor protein RcdA n=1 Tax=Rhodoligotrophos defluvii TaxID=2561934 RepID=UPI001EEFB1F9|nr:DUF1465 family protein [Rhodoligotrophos defluvii]
MIDFGSRFATSALFTQIFAEGMSLVEEAADYLDGEGRAALRDLDRGASLTYASESMRLTTRLMQLASWLLLQRAVKEGELTQEDARREKQRINLKDIGSTTDEECLAALPAGLQSLIQRSLHLHRRVLKLDRMIYDRRTQPRPQASPVYEQMMMLQRAFAGK